MLRVQNVGIHSPYSTAQYIVIKLYIMQKPHTVYRMVLISGTLA